MADPAPTDATDDSAGAPDAGGDATDQGSNSTVLLTVMDNHDGSYTLIEGDEGESDTDEGGGAAPGAAGASDQSTEGGEQGQTFDSPGALLKGILDIIKKSEESVGGEGSADDQFQAGYAGGSSASLAKPTMAQKY